MWLCGCMLHTFMYVMNLDRNESYCHFSSTKRDFSFGFIIIGTCNLTTISNEKLKINILNTTLLSRET